MAMAKPSIQKIPRAGKPLRFLISAMFALGCLLAIIFLYYSGLQVYISVITAFAALIVTGEVITKTNGLDGFFGLYMLKSKRGLSLIEKISRWNTPLWKGMAEWGGVLGFGLLSYIIFRRQIRRRTMALGMASIALIVLLVVPNASLFFKFLSLPGLNLPLLSQFTSATIQLPQPSIGIMALLAVSIIGGFLFFMIALLGVAAFGILAALATAVASTVTGSTGGYAALSTQVPGVAPIIPGLTIPLFSGILALFVVLVVHEFSHGILAKVAKIKLKSIGILPLGIIPVGAFVEPDEKQVEKLDKDRQNDIFIAGISSNFLLTFVFFALTALMIIYVMPALFRPDVVVAYTLPGYPAHNVLTQGSIVYDWNGYHVSNLSSIIYAAHNFTPYAVVTVNTSNGNYAFHTNSTGKIGVVTELAQTPKAKGPQNGLANFLYSFFVISFVLNFFVGGMNLLPLPLLDGWRIYKNRIKSKRTLYAIGGLTFIGIVILALPWIWIL